MLGPGDAQVRKRNLAPVTHPIPSYTKEIKLMI